MELSESDYAEACRIVKYFFATQWDMPNGGVRPKQLQNFYAEQLDQTDGDLVAQKRANFPSAVVRMIERKHILKHDEERNVFIPLQPAISRDPDDDKESDFTSAIRAHKDLQRELNFIAPRSRINQTLTAGIDPKGLAPRHKKRRFTEVDESDASANGTPFLSPGQHAIRNSSPQRLTRPALAPLDGNRRISATSRFYSPSVQSESSALMNCPPNLDLKQEKQSSLPFWLVTGMNALREKYPDARFEPKSNNDLECLDCERRIAVATTKKMYTFENHLKSKGHRQIVQTRLDGSASSRAPVTAAPSVASMPPPPISIPAIGSFESAGSNGGLLESIIENAIRKNSEAFDAQIQSLEARIIGSERSHNQKFEEMTRIFEELSRRNQDLASQIEESRTLADNLSERLAASERRKDRLAASLKSLDDVIEVLQSSQRSSTTQMHGASKSIKSLEQTVQVLTTSTKRKFEAQEAQVLALSRQCAATAEDLSQKFDRHSKTQGESLQSIRSQVRDQFGKFSKNLATMQTVADAQKNELRELKQEPLQAAQDDQGRLSLLKSQILAEIRTSNETLTSQLKLVEKKISKQAVEFTSLDHRTAEWVNSTQDDLGSRMTSLENSFEQRIKSVNLNVGVIHQRAERASALSNSNLEQMTSLGKEMSKFQRRSNDAETQMGSLASRCCTWKDAQEDELHNMAARHEECQAALRKLREECMRLLRSNEESIHNLENHQDDRDLSLKASIRNTIEVIEERMTEKISLLRACYEKMDKSLSDLAKNPPQGLNVTMETYIRDMNTKHTELVNTMQRGQEEIAENFRNYLQERIDLERQHQTQGTKALIQEYVAKRDSELTAKYEEQFKPLILKFMMDQSESLKKEHERQMRSSFETLLKEREQQLEKKYEESFKPMIAKFITDQQKDLREENEARIRSLLEKHTGELSKLASQHSMIKSEQDMRSFVLRIVEDEGISSSGASDLIKMELGCLEETTQERLLSLKQTLEARCQQLDDFDALLPYLLADVDALRKRIRKIVSRHFVVKKRRASFSG
ncbi:hypothetical protein ACMFMG_003441 [Clarireedia jacksonii]